MTQSLNVWMNGECVGRWSVDRESHRFGYAPEWLASPHRRSLSLSLPISGARDIQGDAVRNYFDNLLPDNDRIRDRLARRFRLRRADSFDLLAALGRDCVGAVQLLPDDETPVGWNRIDGESLNEAQVAELLRAVPSDAPWAGASDDDLFRISIAGAQEKTAFTRWRGRWCRPHGATPTTHIFKLPLGLIGGSRRVDASDSVHNEWLCAQILTALGLQVAPTAIERFDGQAVLVVERFDRAWMDGRQWIARLPQEDFCQAFGLPPEMKYEQHGGPGMQRCLQLAQGSEDRQDTGFFLLAQLAFCLLAATDGHAKNFSLHLLRGDAYQMTPLYDVLSMYPYYGPAPSQFQARKAGLAMAVRSKNVHRAFHTIQARHWHQLAMKNGGAAVWDAMGRLVDRSEGALADVEAQLPADFPARTWSAISAGMRREAKRFRSEAAALGRV